MKKLTYTQKILELVSTFFGRLRFILWILLLLFVLITAVVGIQDLFQIGQGFPDGQSYWISFLVIVSLFFLQWTMGYLSRKLE